MALSVSSNEYSLISEKLIDDCLRIIFEYLSDNDLIISGKVDTKFNRVVHEILLGKKELKLEYRDDYRGDILEAIKTAGSNLQKLHIVGKLDSDFFEIIYMFCPSIKTLDLELCKSNSFRINLNLTELQDLKLKWMKENFSWKRIPDGMKKVIKDQLKESTKLQNLHLINFKEKDLEEMEFPSSLKGLRIISTCKLLKNAQNLFKKIQNECKEIEKLGPFPCWINREDLKTLKEMGRNCENIQHLELRFLMDGYMDLSFLSEFPYLKELYLWIDQEVEIDLFQLFSSNPNIETLHLDDAFRLKEFKNANLSKLKNFGFELMENKHLENFEKFNSLETMTFYDLPYECNFRTDEFWDSFFKILPHLKNAQVIEFVRMNYEDSFYKRMKSLTQNRERKIRIRIKNEKRKIIPRDGNDKFIIEEWSYADYEKIHWNLF